jgi:hypothetical protein
MNEIKTSELMDALETVGFRNEDDNSFVSNFGGELSFYRDYSGRGMYGATCFGITVNSHASTTMFMLAVREVIGLEDTVYLASAMRSDSMGYDTIVYFPGWTLTD